MDVSKLTYEQISEQADALWFSGKEAETIELIGQGLEKADAEDDEAYGLFFQAEVAYYEEKDLKKALELHKKALEQAPQNILFLRNVGVQLSYLGLREEAIEYYDRALEIKSDDYLNLQQKAVSLSMLGRPEEAIEYYDRALEIKPDDYFSLWNKGAALSKLNQQEEALKLIKKALKNQPESAHAWAWKSTVEEEMQDYEAALASRQTEKKFEKDESRHRYISSKIAFLQKKIEDKHKKPEERSIKPEADILAKVIDAFEVDKRRILDTISKNKSKLESFTSEERSTLQTDCSCFSVLRKWNSYTPILPSEKGDNRGGGYFLYIHGKDGRQGRGIVIDPGFNFVENFYEEGFKAADIDAVLISHAHNDHTVDLEAILTLINEINKKIDERNREIEEESDKIEKKKIDLFLNLGTFLKYSGWLNIKNSGEINEIRVLHEGNEYDFSEQYNGLKIHAIKAKHDEIVDDKYCLGFILEVDDFKIALTGDTGWNVDNSIAVPYLKHDKIDLMVAHLGSIEESEFEYLEKTTDDDRQDCLYEKHLGFVGVGAMLDRVKPRLAVISEFGEELKPLRKESVEKYDKVLTNTRCVPGDVGLHIRIPQLGIYCIVHRDFVPYDEICIFGQPTESDLHFYKDAESESDRAEILAKAREFASKERAISLFDRIALGPITIR